MKTLLCICMFATALAAADQPAAATKAAAAKPAVKKFTPLTIPADATPLGAMGRYRWTDKDGKVWIYQKTPFGVHRAPETGPDPGPITTAAPQGDSIRFTQETASGSYTWVRKKSELNDSERKILAAQKTGKE